MPRPHLSHKLKHWFDKPTDTSSDRDAGVDDSSSISHRPKPKSLSASQVKALHLLGKENDDESRLVGIHDVVTKVLDGRALPQGTIEQILDSLSDLATCSHRLSLAGLNLVDQLVSKYPGAAPASIIFNLIAGQTDLPELEIRLKILDNLSKNETDIGYFVSDYTSLLLTWLHTLLPPEGVPVSSASTFKHSAGSAERHASDSEVTLSDERRLHLMLYFLQVLRESIKRKTAYFHPGEMHIIITSVTHLACNSTNVTEKYECLDVIKNILAYDTIERQDDSLLYIVTMLCFLSGNRNLVERVWQLLTLVLQTPLKFNALQIMGRLLEDPTYGSVAVTRGAVSFLGLAIWGPQRVEHLLNSPSAILSSMAKCADREVSSSFSPGDKGVVCYEILLQVRRLVEKFLESLQMTDCDLVVQILTSVGKLIHNYRGHVSKDLIDTFHGILTFIEAYHDKKKHLHGAEEQFFYLVESHSKDRSEESINFLLEYRYKRIGPDKDRWLGTFRQLMTDHLLEEARCGIRTKAVNIFKRIYTDNWFHYGDKIIDQVVKPCCDAMMNDRDYEVLAFFVDTVLDICRDTARQDLFEDMVGFLRSILNSPRIFKRKSWSGQEVQEHFEFVERVVSSLLEIKESLWFSSRAAHAIVVHECLVDHLSVQYKHGLGSFSVSRATAVRGVILSYILNIRCNATVHVGRLRGNEEADFSKFMVHCSTGFERSPPQSPSHKSDIHKPAVFEFSAGFDTLLLAILKEKSFKVWKLVMEKLPKFLIFSKPIICAVGSAKLEALALSLVKLATDAPKSGLLFETTDPVSDADINDLIYPSLGPLVAYRSHFSFETQRELYQAIQAGLRSEKSVRAVLAVSSCILELGPAIKPLIPELLERLARLPSTPSIAVPILEIFGVLVRYFTEYKPALKEEDYGNVFVVLGSYWDPFRFAAFIVAQAFHISCIWFACTPLRYRHRAVILIMSNLQKIEQQIRGNVDPSLNEVAELHVIAAYDFLRLYGFSDSPLERLTKTTEAALLSSAGKINAESWIYEDRIITIKMPDSNVTVPKDPDMYSPDIPLNQATFQLKMMGSSTTGELPSSFDNMSMDRRRHFSEQVSLSKSSPPSRKTSTRSRDDISAVVGSKRKMQRIQSMDSISTKSNPPAPEQTLSDVMHMMAEASEAEPTWAIVEVRHACGLNQYMVDLAGNNNLALALYDCGRMPNWIMQPTGLMFPTDPTMVKMCDPGSDLTERPAAVTPSSLFLRMFLDSGPRSSRVDLHDPSTRPVKIAPASDAEKRIDYFDRVLSPRVGRSIGVIFLAMGQKTEKEVLSNRYGSPRYERFIRGLGEMVHLPSYGMYGEQSHDFVGGLATSGRDGEYAIVYEDTMSRIVFHVVTLMTANGRDTISSFLSLKDILVSDDAAPNLCRQMALRAELSSKMWSDSSLGEDVYLSRPVERLREIRRVRAKYASVQGSGGHPSLGVFGPFVDIR